MTDQKKLTGKCKFFDRKKGWGFITGSDGKDMFVHQTDILMDGFRALKDGQSVKYELSTRDDGRVYAVNVTVIEDKKPDIGHACAVVLTPDGMKPVLMKGECK